MDNDFGKGGSYIYDAKTKTRTLIERTQDDLQQPAPAESSDPAKTNFDKKSKKG